MVEDDFSDEGGSCHVVGVGCDALELVLGHVGVYIVGVLAPELDDGALRVGSGEGGCVLDHVPDGGVGWGLCGDQRCGFLGWGGDDG